MLKTIPTLPLSQDPADLLPPMTVTSTPPLAGGLKSIEGFEEVRFKNPQTQEEFQVSTELRRDDPFSLTSVSSFSGAWPTAQPQATHGYFGSIEFTVSFDEAMKKGKKNCDYSPVMNKLFVDINHVFPVVFQLKDKSLASLPPGAFIRATPVFVEGEFRDLDVKVCPVHRIAGEPEHILRAKNKDSRLVVEEPGGAHSRYSLVFPFSGKKTTEHLQFLCYSSCHELKRRRLEVLFTLEVPTDQHTNRVLGRNQVEAKICSYPVRDRTAEEARLKPDPKRVEKPKGRPKKNAAAASSEKKGAAADDDDYEEEADEHKHTGIPLLLFSC